MTLTPDELLERSQWDFFWAPPDAVVVDRPELLYIHLMAVQPRIRMTRSFDQRSHEYLGYVLRVDGTADKQRQTFLVAVGNGAHAKHQFRSGGSF